MAYTSLKRIGRRNLPEHVRIVGRRGEDVDGLHQGQVVVEPIHARIVAGRRADQHPRIIEKRQPVEHAVERGLVDLGSAAGALDQAHQAHRPGVSVELLAGARADVVLLEDIAGQDFLALQMQCPNRIERCMTRLRFAKSFMRHRQCADSRVRPAGAVQAFRVQRLGEKMAMTLIVLRPCHSRSASCAMPLLVPSEPNRVTMSNAPKHGKQRTQWLPVPMRIGFAMTKIKWVAMHSCIRPAF